MCVRDYSEEESPTHAQTTFLMFITLSETKTGNWVARRLVILGKQTVCVCMCVGGRKFMVGVFKVWYSESPDKMGGSDVCVCVFSEQLSLLRPSAA